MWHVLTTICLHANQNANMACNLNCVVETEGHLKVTVTCTVNVVKSWKRSRMNRDVVTTNHDYEMISSSSFITAKAAHTRMWANAQRDGRPAERRWRPLFNAAKFG